jgi:uncharacterized protein (TIGR02421 family)
MSELQTATPSLPASREARSDCGTIKALSDRIVEAQRPIRILDAIKWDESVEARFVAQGCRELPEIDRDYYASRPLGFDLEEKRREFQEIELEITRALGRLSPVGGIMRRMCREYLNVLRMLEARGTPDFTLLSQELYGSTNEAFHAGEPTLADLGERISHSLAKINLSPLIGDLQKDISGEEAIQSLGDRLRVSMNGCGDKVRVILDDGIVADAAAGSDYIKIRKDAKFDARELRLLEVHEGWVHVGTTLNGSEQPYCTFLSKGTPSSTVTQEGLAVLMEIFAFASFPARLHRLTNRINAVHMAEEGADFLDVFRFHRAQGLGDHDSYVAAMRVFRGSSPTAGPFTKDICYTKGFTLLYNFLRFAVRAGKLEAIPLLFCGKTVLEDIRVLKHLLDEGLLIPPTFVPPQFADMHGLTAWMCYADFLGTLNFQKLETDYAELF